jgi:D-alanyl-lipoteichoic acid acyltransferase DltB (MBOAT superfamily)
MYDLGHTTGAPPLKDYLSYFFLIPNYYFLMFPVIDFQTFRKSFFKRDIHTVAQKGIWWIFRGTTHLLLYRLIYQAQGRFSPPHVSVPMAVAAKAAFIYLLYLRISGQFHIITGMLALFGYDLPETNRYYLLARSVNDLWRRNNIYWKDFMVKIVYFPAYFRMRRQGERRAQLLATALVFAVTWFLHAVQFFWLQGKFLITLNDTVFWMILGSMVVADVWIAAVRRKRLPRTGWLPTLQRAVQIAATFAFMSLLWSMWSANSMSEWFLFLKTGNV